MSFTNGSFNFTTAARSLALPIDDDDQPPTPSRPTATTTPSWFRRTPTNNSNTSRTTSGLSNHPHRPHTSRDKWMQEAEKWQRRAVRTWYHFTPLQRAGIMVLNVILLVLTILFLIYNQAIFAKLAPAAKAWREMPGGWMILWLITFVCAFPPMIGYSTSVTTAGFVFGMKGFLIVATANVAGSVCSFIVSRTVLKRFVERLTERNTQFAALSLVIKHDGLKLLTMIRLCPLPYSLSNGAISTIPTVTWQNFGIATALASPKLLLHVFVGSRLGDLAENGDKMDAGTRIVSYVSIAIGVVAGFLTGYFVYVRTKARAQQLEVDEGLIVRGEFADEPEEGARLPRGEDEISLHRTYEDLEGGSGGAYRDEFTDDEDALERDVFDLGDGEDEEEEAGRKKDER